MHHVSCDLCGADEPMILGERPLRADVLHARFVRCTRCGFVYADPRAGADEARRFYSAVHDRGSGSLEHEPGSVGWRRAVEARKVHLGRAASVLQTGVGTRFLDIGFGDGSALAAAHELGWDAHGLEFGDWLVEAARRRLPFANVQLGDAMSSGFESGTFDVIYSWHVIEHVLDVQAWLEAVTRLLRPAGVVVLGTESSEALYGRLVRLGFRALGQMPRPTTSTDHTYWFSSASLAVLLERAGMQVLEVSAYENSPLQLLRQESVRRLRNPRWAADFALYFVSSVAAAMRPNLGGKLIALAVKPERGV